MRSEKKYPAEHLGGKKNILPTGLLGKKNLLTSKHYLDGNSSYIHHTYVTGYDYVRG